jgi:hypothetical protein
LIRFKLDFSTQGPQLNFTVARSAATCAVWKRGNGLLIGPDFPKEATPPTPWA